MGFSSKVIWLLVGLNPSEKYDFVNWDDEKFPIWIWENKIDGNQTTNQFKLKSSKWDFLKSRSSSKSAEMKHFFWCWNLWWLGDIPCLQNPSKLFPSWSPAATNSSHRWIQVLFSLERNFQLEKYENVMALCSLISRMKWENNGIINRDFHYKCGNPTVIAIARNKVYLAETTHLRSFKCYVTNQLQESFHPRAISTKGTVVKIRMEFTCFWSSFQKQNI